jgi:hypothetical protein
LQYEASCSFSNTIDNDNDNKYDHHYANKHDHYYTNYRDSCSIANAFIFYDYLDYLDHFDFHLHCSSSNDYFLFDRATSGQPNYQYLGCDHYHCVFDASAIRKLPKSRAILP